METANAKTASLEGPFKEGEHYFLFKDGRGIPHKVANLDHPMFHARNFGTVTLESYRVAANHRNGERPDIETKSMFRAVKDRATGWWFGIPIGINDHDKQITWAQYPLRMQNTFDLSKVEDRKMFACLSRDPRVEGSPNQSGKPLYKVIDSHKKNMDYMENRSKRKRCEEIIEGLNYEQLIELAPSIGINPRAYNQQDMHAEFFRYAENNFTKFLELWDSPNRQITTTFKRALNTGVIQRVIVEGTNGMMHVYQFEGLALGSTESEAVAFLSSNDRASMLTSILFRTSEAEKSMKQNNTKVLQVDKARDLEREVAELRAQLAAKQEKSKSTVTYDTKDVEVIPGIIQTKEGPKDVDTVVLKQDAAAVKSESYDMAKLLAEAKDLKIRGAHFIKDPEKLAKKIAEAKQ